MTERDAKGLLMSANELRQAAEKLRARAEAATPGPWIASGRFITTDARRCTCCGIPPHEPGCGLDDPHAEAYGDDPAYIATMHPDVGLALAGWLDDAAAWEGTPNTVNHDMRAHDIARLINGGA